MAAQEKSWQIDKLDKRVSQMSDDSAVHGPMVLDVNWMSTICDLQFEVWKLTSTGDPADCVNLEPLLRNLFQSVSAAELELTQVCEHGARITNCKKELLEYFFRNEQASSNSSCHWNRKSEYSIQVVKSR